MSDVTLDSAWEWVRCKSIDEGLGGISREGSELSATDENSVGEPALCNWTKEDSESSSGEDEATSETEAD
jgi:hypothetical protein